MAARRRGARRPVTSSILLPRLAGKVIVTAALPPNTHIHYLCTNTHRFKCMHGNVHSLQFNAHIQHFRIDVDTVHLMS